jgi:protein-tyrosine sulfotransferase
MALKSPIFILGSHKSGSSLLRSLFDNHPELYVIPTEVHYFQCSGYWIDYRLRYSLPSPKNNRDLIEYFVQFVGKKNSHVDPYADSVVTNQFDLDKFRDFLEKSNLTTPSQAFEAYIQALYFSTEGQLLPSELRIVEKSVENAEFAIFLRQMMPDCKFVHIVRNPYATLVAIRKVKTKSNYPFLQDFIASLWNSYYYLLKNQAFLDNYLVVRYEELLSNPQEKMKEISEFIEIQYSDTLLKPTLMGKAWGGNSSNSQQFSHISTAPLSKWKKEINDLEIHLVNSQLGTVIEELGYERLTPEKSKYWPIQGEDIKSYFKNRSIFWMTPHVCQSS